jgi:hypothetical protein
VASACSSESTGHRHISSTRGRSQCCYCPLGEESRVWCSTPQSHPEIQCVSRANTFELSGIPFDAREPCGGHQRHSVIGALTVRISPKQAVAVSIGSYSLAWRHNPSNLHPDTRISKSSKSSRAIGTAIQQRNPKSPSWPNRRAADRPARPRSDAQTASRILNQDRLGVAFWQAN